MTERAETGSGREGPAKRSRFSDEVFVILRLGGDYHILKTMKRWLPIVVVGVGVLLGSVVPQHFSPHPADRPTVSHEQPALPAHPEHGGDREIKPGPTPQIQTARHATATSVNAKTRPDAESGFTGLGSLVVVALVLVFYGALGTAAATRRLVRARMS